MKIISESIIPETNSKEMLPQALNRIFLVSKLDPNFPLKEQLSDIERESVVEKSKLQKKIELVEKSNGLKNDLQSRIASIDEKNYDMRYKLLGDLGSEL